MTSQVVPVLEAIAANDGLRSLRRFERDYPPPHEASTNSEEVDNADFIPPPPDGLVPEEMKAIRDPPLDDDEVNSVSHWLREVTRPHDLHYIEAKREGDRFESHQRGPRLQRFREMNVRRPARWCHRSS